MENKTSRLAMEIADDILEEFTTIRKVIHSAADGDLADIIQRSIDHYRNSQLMEDLNKVKGDVSSLKFKVDCYYVPER